MNLSSNLVQTDGLGREVVVVQVREDFDEPRLKDFGCRF